MNANKGSGPIDRREREEVTAVSDDEAQKSEYYQGESGETYQLAVHGQEIMSPAVHRAKAELARYRYFRELPADARVFEFGTGAGFNLRLVVARELAGFDVSETARDLTRGYGIQVFDDMATVPDRHYDVVLCRHVLEHVPNPAGVLASMAVKIAPNGRLLLVLPVEHGRRHQRGFAKDDVNQHLYSWKLQHIANLLDSCGFEIEDFKYEWYSAQRLLRWMPRVFGVRVFSAAVTAAGFIRRQSEIVITAKFPDGVR